MIDPIKLIERCLREADGDTEAGLAAAEYILVNGLDAPLTVDAHGREHKGKGEGGGQFIKGKTSHSDTGTHIGVHHKTKRVLTFDNGQTIEVDGPSGMIEAARDKNKNQLTIVKVHVDDELRGQGLPRRMLAELAVKAIKENLPIRTTGVFSTSGKQMMDKLVRDGLASVLPNGDYEIDSRKILDKYGPASDDNTKNNAMSVYFAHDIANRSAQGVLNRSLEAARGLSADARRDLESAIDASQVDSGAAILAFVDRYHLQLARLLTQAQMAALLEGAREVAAKVPALEADAQARADLFGDIPLPTFPVGAAFSGHDVSDEPRDEEGKWTKGGGEVWKFSDDLPDHDDWKDLEADPDYFYHASNTENAANIQESEMKPHRPWHGTEQSTWPDGSTAKRIYFTDKPKTAWQFAPEDGKPVLLRVKKHKLITKEKGTSDFHLEGKKLPAHLIEILTSAGWKLLKKLASAFATDAHGHEHRGKGEGGGQFTGSGLQGVSDDHAVLPKPPQHWQDYALNDAKKMRPDLASKSFLLKLIPVTAARPSQTGEDYLNDSSRALAESMKEVETEGSDAINRSNDYYPIVVRSDGEIVDGNHRHAAHTINKYKYIWAMVEQLKKAVGLSINAAFAQGIASLAGTISEAVKWLAGRNVVSRPGYDALDAQARQKAFTVAGVDAQDTLAKIRDALAENVREGASHATFRAKVLEAVDAGTFLSPNHLETVFRTNVQTAFSKGQLTILQNPRVQQGFPYAAYDAIHDSRARHDHLELEKHGIGGSNVYRSDDPVFQTFRPPWDYNCRCSWTPLTVRQAAEAGVSEAQAWQQSGVAPLNPARVSMPPFNPPDGFQRAVAGAPLSVRLSMQPMGMFDPNQYAYERDTVPSPSFPQGEGGEDYPRDGANRFLDKYRIANAVQDSEVLWALRESLPEAERPKLDAAAACLRDGGCVHHPSEPAGMGVNTEGAIADPLWAEYAERWDAWSARDGNCEDSLKRVCAFRKQVTSTTKVNAADNDMRAGGAARATTRIADAIRAYEARWDELEAGLDKFAPSDALRKVQRLRYRGGVKLDRAIAAYRRVQDASEDKEPIGPFRFVCDALDALRDALDEAFLDAADDAERALERQRKEDAEPKSPAEWPRSSPAFSVDKRGHKHRDKGEGGGQFTGDGSSGGVDIEGRASAGMQSSRLARKFTRALTNPSANKNFPPELKAHYGTNMEKALKFMTPTALSLLGKNVKRVSFHENTKEIANTLLNDIPGFRESVSDQEIDSTAGCYNHETGIVYIDGAAVEDEGPYATYIHEFAHAIDRGRVFSDTDEWYEAWSEELSDGTLCDYAGTNPEEGFAELARYFYDDEMDQEALAETFPKCAALWKKWGLR